MKGRANRAAQSAFARALAQLQAEMDASAAEEGSVATQKLADTAPERRTRRQIIDRVLIALGWDWTSPSRALAEEARLRRADHVRYADYLGFTFPESRPLLLIEAKESNAAPPEAQQDWVKASPFRARDTLSLIQASLDFNASRKTGELPEVLGPSPLSLAWQTWLSDLRDYATRAKAQHGFAPRVAVITSGLWWLVVRDVSGLIEGRDLGSDGLDFYPRLEDLNDPPFRETLARDQIERVPDTTIEPFELTQYCDPKDVSWIGNALWTANLNDGLPRYSQPRIVAGPGVVVVANDDRVLRIAGNKGSVVPTDTDALAQHHAEIDGLRGALIADLRKVAPSLPPISNLDTLDPRLSADDSFLSWSWPQKPHVTVLALGEPAHFIQFDIEFGTCPHHDYSQAEQDGHGLRTPYLAQSKEPPVYFITGNKLHCASQIVHDSRKERCKIAPIDVAYCCRACRYFSVCWTDDEAATLPCNVLRRAVTASAGGSVDD